MFKRIVIALGFVLLACLLLVVDVMRKVLR